MIKIYGSLVSRATRPLLALEEARAEYELIEVDFYKGQHKAPEYLKVNPLGKVPALVDGDFLLLESAAQCNYIAMKYPDSHLMPTKLQERARYDQWMFFAMTDLEKPLIAMMMHRRLLPENLRVPSLIDHAMEEFSKLLVIVEEEVKNKDFLVGNNFTCADIVVGQTLFWASKSEVTLTKNCQRYLTAMKGRESFKRLMSKHQKS